MRTTIFDRARVELAALEAWLWRLVATFGRRLAAGARDRGAERGDVPGWVLVTLMSALLVVALIGVAKAQLVNVFTNAINSVSGA